MGSCKRPHRQKAQQPYENKNAETVEKRLDRDQPMKEPPAIPAYGFQAIPFLRAIAVREIDQLAHLDLLAGIYFKRAQIRDAII